MLTPLDISPEAANSSAAAAKKRLGHARSNARAAIFGAYLIVFAALIYVVAQTTTTAMLAGVALATFGAVALAFVAKRRVDVLERKLWWHQMRSALVDELRSQAENKDKIDVIDLRDSIAIERNN